VLLLPVCVSAGFGVEALGHVGDDQAHHLQPGVAPKRREHAFI
jgi:hypothetical protein